MLMVVTQKREDCRDNAFFLQPDLGLVCKGEVLGIGLSEEKG